MAEKIISFVLVLSLLFIASTMATKQPYVVYLGGQHDENVDRQLVVESHHELLALVRGSNEAAKHNILYSYSRNINGFVATLNEEKALTLSNLPHVLFVFARQTSFYFGQTQMMGMVKSIWVSQPLEKVQWRTYLAQTEKR